MSDSIRCPDCGTPTPANARFCPWCGRPRTFLREQLAEEARTSGVPLDELLGRERASDLAGEPVATTLARLERRINEIESFARGRESRYVAPRPASVGPAVQTLAGSPAKVEEQVEVPRAPSRPLIPATPPQPFDLESLITGKILAWVGGLALALGAAFFLSVAFSSGWIGPGLRVVIGVVTSLAMLSAGTWFFERKERLFGHVLVATSLGIMSLSLLAATRLYEFVPPEIGVLSAVAVATIATLIAVRADSQIVAAFGLIAGLASPPIVGAEASYTTLAFITVALAGAVAVALYRTWRWLPPVAFLLSAPQAANFLTSDINAGIAISVLAGFWALYTMASGGEEFRRTTDRLSPTSTTLLVLNALFLLAIGFEVLSDGLDKWRGLFLLGAAASHGLFGGYFLYVRHERHHFGMLTSGIGIAFLTLAVPIQLGGPAVPIAWAALATALAWLYGERRHEYSGVLAVVLGGLSVIHLFRFEYPIHTLPEGIESTWPYFNSSGGTLVFILAALAANWFLVRHDSIRPFIVAAGGILIALSAPFEVRPAAAIVIWSTVAVVFWILIAQQGQIKPYRVTAGTITTAGVAWVILDIARPGRLFIQSDSAIEHPLFWSAATVALLALIASLAIGYFASQDSRDGRVMGTVATALGVYLLSVGIADEFQSRVISGGAFESLQKQSQVALSILWASLGIFAFVLGLVRWGAHARVVGLALLALATAKVFVYDLASLDASYRVLSFIGLGVILLVSSFAYQHFTPLFDRQSRSGSPVEEPPA